MKQIMIFMLLALLSSCGSKPKKPTADMVKETNSYMAQLHTDQNVANTTSEGALTDKTGSKDIGEFTLKTYYNKSNHGLLHIENIEKTDKVVAENFYFKEGQLIFVSTQTNTDKPMKLYLYKDKVINQSNMDLDHQKILLNKARLFKKEYKKGH